MSLSPFLAIDPILLVEDRLVPQEILGADAPVPAARDDTLPVPAATPVPAPEPEPAATPAFAPLLVPEDAFPTAAEMDAIFADLAGPPPGLDADLRAEVAALLGLDPAVAEDAALFEATLAQLAPPAPEPDPQPPFSEAPWPALDWAAMMRDWGDLSPGWFLG